MSLGVNRSIHDVRITSALLLITTEQPTSHEVGPGPASDMRAAAKSVLFNHFVGAAARCLQRGEHCPWSHAGKIRKDMMMNIDGDRQVTPVCHTSALISSAARPPIMYDAALVPGPEIIDGMTEASATRSPRGWSSMG